MSLGQLDIDTLLRMAVESTPRMIYPERAIGRFEPGYEASLIVLRQDPLEDLSALRDIALVFKQGHLILDGPARSEAPSGHPKHGGTGRDQ